MKKSKPNNDKPRMKAGKLIQQLMLAAALVIFSAAFTACSSDDNSNEQPIHMNEPQEYTMTVQVKKTDVAATRALYIDGKTQKLKVKWNAGEIVKVVQENQVIGQLTAAASENASTTLSGTLNSAPVADKALYFYLHDTTRDYSGQNGTIEDISANHDFAWGTVASGAFSVDGTKVTVPAGVSLNNTPQAIVKFTLLKFEDSKPLSTTELKICDETTSQNIVKTYNYLDKSTTKDDITVTATSATNEFYVALSDISNMKLNLLVNTDSDPYTYTKADVTFANGKYYEVSVKMAPKDVIRGLFSVSSTKKVYFSKGNMQFSTNNGSSWTAVFADHQYDVIGDAPGNNILYGTLSLTSYPGTVDLFGWSTPTGKQAFYGVKSSTEDADYAGDFYDWGNAFEAPWRTLSMNEWQWLLDNARWLRATVDGHKVFIIFPDVFAWDTASMGPEPTTCNAANDDYAKTITAEQWTALESAGAVLLPAGGVRVGSKVTMTDYDGHYLGYYWSSTPKTDNDNKTDAYYLTFGKNIVKATQSNPRHYGYSVRLVRNAN